MSKLSNVELFFCVQSMCFVYITAFFISHHLGPVIPTSAILKNGSPHRVTHLLPMWDLLLAWHRHSGTRNLGFTSHSEDNTIEVK
jgi:hypothetical protein